MRLIILTLAWVTPAIIAEILGWRGIWGSGSAFGDALIPIPVAGGCLHVVSFCLSAAIVYREHRLPSSTQNIDHWYARVLLCKDVEVPENFVGDIALYNTCKLLGDRYDTEKQRFINRFGKDSNELRFVESVAPKYHYTLRPRPAGSTSQSDQQGRTKRFRR